MMESVCSEFEAKFLIGPSTNGELSVTGEPYVEVCSGGIGMDGGRVWYPTAKLAISAWREAAEGYADSVVGSTLYWRERPILSDRVVTDINAPLALRVAMSERQYTVSSRFLISDKPVSIAFDEGREALACVLCGLVPGQPWPSAVKLADEIIRDLSKYYKFELRKIVDQKIFWKMRYAPS